MVLSSENNPVTPNHERVFYLFTALAKLNVLGRYNLRGILFCPMERCGIGVLQDRLPVLVFR